MKGQVFILSAPAGTGKTTLVDRLVQEMSHVRRSISCTTRPARSGEVEGKDYYFLSQEEFDRRRREGDFLESANVFGYDYGTSKALVSKMQQEGKHVFLVIDTQGALHLKKQGFEAVWIFVSPPSIEELERRLIARKTDAPEVIVKRISWAKDELKQVVHYDYHIVNDRLEEAYQVLKSIVVAQEHRIIT